MIAIGTRKIPTGSAVKKQPLTKRTSVQENSSTGEDIKAEKLSVEDKSEAVQAEQPGEEGDVELGSEQDTNQGTEKSTAEVAKMVMQDVEETVADAEVAAVTKLRIKEAPQGSEIPTGLANGSSPPGVPLHSSRPHTPEVTQLRNKFETLGTNQPSRSSSSTIQIQSKSPNHVKNLINRFAG